MMCSIRTAMQRFLQDLRFSFRSLRKTPGFALTAILTLALGIGAVTSIFSVVDSVLLKPFDFPDPGCLVLLRERVSGLMANGGPDNPKHFLNWQSISKTFSGMALFSNGGHSLSSGTDHPEIVNGMDIEPNFFSVLGVHPILGREFLPVEATKGHDREAIITWDAWQRYFHGDRGVVGKILRDGGTPVTVVGVLPRDFSFPHISEIPGTGESAGKPYEIFVPLVIRPDQSVEGNYNYLAIGRVCVGLRLAQAQIELSTIQSAFNQAHKLTTNPQVMALPLITGVAGDVSTGLWLLLAAVGAVLLIGCVNLANLQLARAVARDRELAVRSALGATRGRLVSTALADSFVLAAAGGALGILLSFVCVRLFVAAAPKYMPRLSTIQVSWPVLLGAAALSILTALFFGLLPALRSMRVDPQTALQTASTRVSSSRETQHARHLLVGAEVACTLALLIMTGLLARSFATLLNQNRDFDSSHITLAQAFLYAPQYGDTVKGSEKVRAAFDDRALADLGRLPGVQSVAMTSEQPMAGETWIDTVERPDRPLPPNLTPDANIRWISPSYASTLRIPLVAGRDLNGDDKQHPTNALISEQAARAIWPGENPIGRIFTLEQETKYTVAGVLADARINDLKSTANMIYLPYWDNAWWRANFLIRSAQPTSTLTPEIQHTIWKIDPQVAIPMISSLNEQVAVSVAPERFQAMLLSSFGAAALLLAVLGIYGVLAYSVSLRQQEFGIRMALGCDRAQLMTLVGRQALLPVCGGIIAGLALAFAATRWVQSLLYQTSPADPAAIFGSIVLLAAAALIAAVLPARRAAQIEPMQVLRNE